LLSEALINMYAIVDIETTGGYAAQHGITEIAILIHNGETVIERYQTLINPHQPIPVYIRALTGINEEMVAGAPDFVTEAARIYALLQDKIFVAHNVNFDYSFVKHHLDACGYALNSKKLCTVRLSRKLFPGLPSYSLGKLCASLSIPVENRHRAAGDATATAVLFDRLIEKDTEAVIEFMLKRSAKEQVLPPHLKKTELDKLPDRPGVYYFKDHKGKVIYVGKAKNLKKRVYTHFSGHSISRQRQDFLRKIYHVDYEPCGTELMAFILEAAEIKRLWPENNRAMKRFEQKYSLYQFEDQRGYLRLGIDKFRKNGTVLYSFNQLLQGYEMLRMLIHTYQLCEKLCFIQKQRVACTGYALQQCSGACIGEEAPETYNERVNQAIAQLQQILPSFILIDQGRYDDEKSCLWVENGKFYGMGYVSDHTDIQDAEALKAVLTPYPSNDYMMHLIMAYRERFPYKAMVLNKDTALTNQLFDTF